MMRIMAWLGAFDLPISITRWWIGGHGRR